MLIHVSGRCALLSSRALEFAGIDADTKTPNGGIINRFPDSNEPEGLVMETVYLPLMERIPLPSERELIALMKPAQMMYASAGYTHEQEGATHIKDLDFLDSGSRRGRDLPRPRLAAAVHRRAEMDGNPKYKFGEYHRGLELQGIKFVQGRIAAGQDRARDDAVPHRRTGRTTTMAGRVHPAAGLTEPSMWRFFAVFMMVPRRFCPRLAIIA
jgi:predicted amidohydrolase YtcJ